VKKHLDYYTKMLVIRLFEEKVEELFAAGAIAGTTHPSSGEEAVAVGACAALRKGDFVTSTHRGHGHFIAMGGDPNRIMAELFGKQTGYSRGRGGSQLMADYSLGFLGANGITGGSIPLATGVALAARIKSRQRVVLCFFGDGAANQGTFHESLNMAGIWNLPIVYLCVNNMYAMSMPVGKAMAIRDIADRAASYGFPGATVDGNDVIGVRDAVAAACRRARDGLGPTLVECKTYRLSGHSRGDTRIYRSAGEEAAWKARDPIRLLRQRLMQDGLLDREKDRSLRRNARQVVNQAVRFARQSPDPDPGKADQGVFA
jgi:pyruvate dehydrogenase E1 component alpha subunit